MRPACTHSRARVLGNTPCNPPHVTPIPLALMPTPNAPTPHFPMGREATVRLRAWRAPARSKYRFRSRPKTCRSSVTVSPLCSSYDHAGLCEPVMRAQTWSSARNMKPGAEPASSRVTVYSTDTHRHRLPPTTQHQLPTNYQRPLAAPRSPSTLICSPSTQCLRHLAPALSTSVHTRSTRAGWAIHRHSRWTPTCSAEMRSGRAAAGVACGGLRSGSECQRRVGVWAGLLMRR